MYWIYLAIFVLVIFTPKFIQNGIWFFQEQDIEAILIFCFGSFGFLVYLAKEKALLQVFKEKLHLQKQTNIITRDLSDSYSYIGEMNRKFDIVKDVIFRLPQETTDALEQKKPNLYNSIMEAVCLLAKVEQASLRFVNMKSQIIEKSSDQGTGTFEPFNHFSASVLLAPKKIFWEEEGYVIARSPKQSSGILAFIIFPKNQNRIEDTEIFKILASEALFLYCVEERAHGKTRPLTWD